VQLAADGHGPLRAALSEYLSRGAGGERPDHIVVVGGTQLEDLIARVLLDPGDGAVVESRTIRHHSLRRWAPPLRVPGERAGSMARLPAAAARPRST
jgi:hypothetical protein